MNKQKKIITAIVLGGLALGALLIFRRKGGSRPEDCTLPGGCNGGGGGGIFPTIGALDYAGMADTIHQAMDGYGTGETTIENEILKLRNKGDWDALVSAYGTRKISSGTGNIFQPDFVGDLPSGLKSELDDTELADLNANLRKIGVSI